MNELAITTNSGANFELIAIIILTALFIVQLPLIYVAFKELSSGFSIKYTMAFPAFILTVLMLVEMVRDYLNIVQ